MFCGECGVKMADNAKFCPACGAKTKSDAQPQQQAVQPLTPPAPVTTPVQPVYQQYPQQTQTQPQFQSQSQVKAKKKMPVALIALIIIIPILIMLAAGGLGIAYLFGYINIPNDPDDSISVGLADDSTKPAKSTTESTKATEATTETELSGDIELPNVNYTYQSKNPEAVIEFTSVDSIFPSNYRMMDSLVTFAGYSDFGNLDVLIEVEVPGFTQLYKQKVTLGRQVTKLRIIPPLVTGTLDLNTEKTAQLVYSVTEVGTNKLLVQESKNIKLYSKFDMVWGDEENWDAYTDNILAWMTPDVPEILQLKRDAIDYLDFISEGQLSGLIGYQNYNFFDNYYYNTWVQAVAIQGAMSDITKVRYNNSWFSMDAQQRVKLPADTLSSRSGLCIETALVMASALQSTGMHVMLIFPPGHAQVAVEAWPGSGDYFLIETTVLPMGQDMSAWEYVVQYLDKEQWFGYITGEGDYTSGECYIVDCDLGAKLGIRSISN